MEIHTFFTKKTFYELLFSRYSGYRNPRQTIKTLCLKIIVPHIGNGFLIRENKINMSDKK